MLKNPNSRTKMEKFRQAVKEFTALRGVTDKEAVEELAPQFFIEVETGMFMVRGYGHYSEKRLKLSVAAKSGID